jgi:hypothetical protein
MGADVVVNLSVQNQSVVDVVRRPIRIKWQHGVGIFPSVLEKILGFHRSLSKFFAAFVEHINQHGFFPKLRANISRNFESGAGERMYGNNFAFVEPEPNGDAELTLNRVLARYLQNSLSMSAMTSLFCAVFPLRFPLQNLRARNGHNPCREVLETLERRFLFWWFRMFHVENVILNQTQCKITQFIGKLAHSILLARFAHARNMKERLGEERLMQ